MNLYHSSTRKVAKIIHERSKQTKMGGILCIYYISESALFLIYMPKKEPLRV
jgi:hypothetical protein